MQDIVDHTSAPMFSRYHLATRDVSDTTFIFIYFLLFLSHLTQLSVTFQHPLGSNQVIQRHEDCIALKSIIATLAL